MNTNYYYRWLAGNSVSSENWSVASEEGMLAYWDFDESGGAFSTDSVESRIASFIGISDSDRVFGRKVME